MPFYSYKENKKTVSRRVTDSKLIQVYRRQIQAFRRFQELTVELISLGEKISNTAISDTEEKKTAEVFIEQDKEVSRILEKASKEEKADLEAWEKAIRVAVLSAGARALEGLINTIGSGKREEPLFCVCGDRMESKGLKKKELLTILGQTSYNRSMYRCLHAEPHVFPGDEALDVVNTTRSPECVG